jgi:cell division protein FtsA
MSVKDIKNENSIIVGLDIGTSKVAFVVGEIQPKGSLKIIAQDKYPSKGLSKGAVIDISETTEAIKNAMAQIQVISGNSISSVSVGIVGHHIKSQDIEGDVAISGREVTVDDIQRVLEHVQSKTSIENNHQTLHLLPQEYIIDEQGGIKQPVGMYGVRFKAKVHMITCSSAAVKNLSKCVNHCNLTVDSFILQPLASSIAVLSPDEKNLGVAVVDIGAGTTDIIIYINGAVRYIAMIDMAGDSVTTDIAGFYGSPESQAEKIKLKYGHACISELLAPEEKIKIPQVGGRAPKETERGVLSSVIEDRYKSILEKVAEKIAESGYMNELQAGVVLTGGGAAIEGIESLTQAICNPNMVRVGSPNVENVKPDGNSPDYATTVGLVQYIFDEQQKKHSLNMSPSSPLSHSTIVKKPAHPKKLKKSTYFKVVSWFKKLKDRL